MEAWDKADTDKVDRAVRRRRRRLRGWLLLLAVVLTVGVVIPRWTYGLVRGWFVPTLSAHPGPLELVVQGRGLALWREMVVEAPQAGIVRPLVADGQRVQARQAVAVLEARGEWRSGPDGRDRTVYAPVPGVVRFDWTGPPRPEPEDALAWPDTILGEIGSIRHVTAAGQEVRQGHLLFRLVDNHQAYLLVPWEGGPRVTEGQQVWVRLPAAPAGGRGQAGAAPPAAGTPPAGRTPPPGRAPAAGSAAAAEAAGIREWRATVLGARPVPSGSPGDAILLALHAWPPGWELWDWLDVTVVVQRFPGVVIPERLLVERGGRPGVWVRGRSGAFFHPVQVTGRWDGMAAVEGLPAGLPLLARPPRGSG